MPLIVFEGADAVGKTWQAETYAKYLREQGRDPVMAAEPSKHSPVAQVIYDVLKSPDYELPPIEELLLFTTLRVMLWREVIEPALQEEKVVILARNWLSTLAYQCGYGLGLTVQEATEVTGRFLPREYMYPDCTLILTVTDEERLRRQTKRNESLEELDAFESRGQDYQRRVAYNYGEIVGPRIERVDANGTKEEVQAAIRKVLERVVAR